MGVGEAATLTSELVDVRSVDFGRAVNAGVTVTEIVGEYNDDVGFLLREAGQGSQEKEQGCELLHGMGVI